MKSALFVDFDNIYSALRRLDPSAAERFAQRPSIWVQWLTETLAPPAHAPADARRRILVRRCYLNPHAYQRFRPAFNRAGFEIIDCPPMTSEGKTSTDIHMVLDIVDLLQHVVHYDEFIVFSADADFTPVLRKLRRWDRRTTVLAVGFPSSAYQASADMLIDQEEFMRAGLGFSEPEPESVPTPVEPNQPSAELTTELCNFILHQVADSQRPVSLSALSGKALKEVKGLDAANWAGFSSFRKLMESLRLSPLVLDWESGTILDPSRHTPLTRKPDALDTRAADGLLQDVTQLIRKEVESAKRPVACSRLAQIIVDRHSLLAADWGGRGSFRKLLEALDLAPLVVSWDNGAGRVIDPITDWGDQSQMASLVQKIHAATGMPSLPPTALRRLMELITADVSMVPFALSETSKRVRDQCRDTQLPINRADVSYVLKGILLAGHDFSNGDNNTPTLGNRFIDSMRAICSRDQIDLDEAEERVLRQWAGGAESVAAAPTTSDLVVQTSDTAR